METINPQKEVSFKLIEKLVNPTAYMQLQYILSKAQFQYICHNSNSLVKHNYILIITYVNYMLIQFSPAVIFLSHLKQWL